MAALGARLREARGAASCERGNAASCQHARAVVELWNVSALLARDERVDFWQPVVLRGALRSSEAVEEEADGDASVAAVSYEKAAAFAASALIL